jgi:hypothetical protein
MRLAGNAEREEQMTRADLEEMVEAQLPEFYEMLLGDAKTVVMHHSGFSDDEIALSQRFLVAGVSVFDSPRTKGARANEPRRSTTGPVTGSRCGLERQASKEPAHAREADNWRYTLMAR